ncbi:hypothetical protein [Natrinema amylolyticum]|uniref:hypothetical protein n=1 Tax=Natrinema amylolyticum TaxID=2878679 RepID=UPI001CFA8C23|nr:hypothetical protein [Natrinema amylolyticum]
MVPDSRRCRPRLDRARTGPDLDDVRVGVDVPASIAEAGRDGLEIRFEPRVQQRRPEAVVVTPAVRDRLESVAGDRSDLATLVEDGFDQRFVADRGESSRRGPSASIARATGGLRSSPREVSLRW